MREDVYTVAYTAVLCAVATVLMTGAKAALSRRIAESRTLIENRAKLAGMGLLSKPLDAKATNEAYGNQIRIKKLKGMELYFGYEPDGKTLHSIGILFQGKGFWGPVRGIISTDPAGKTIRGLAFLSHQETPGLGGRISEPWFQEQFKGKNVVQQDEAGNWLQFVPEGTPNKTDKQVDAVSGATRTSESVRIIVNRALGDLHTALAAGDFSTP